MRELINITFGELNNVLRERVYTVRINDTLYYLNDCSGVWANEYDEEIATSEVVEREVIGFSIDNYNHEVVADLK